MNICTMVQSLGPGGRTKRIIETCLGLQKLGHEVQLICFDHPTHSAQYDPESLIPITTVLAPSRFSPMFIQNLRKQVRGLGQTDIIHMHCEMSYLYGGLCARSLRIPTLGTCHRSDIDLLFRSKSRYVWHYLLDHLVTVSNHLGETVASHGLIKTEKLSTIHGGTDLSLYDLAAKSAIRDKLRNDYSLVENCVLVLAMGHLGEIKGHDHSIRALAQLDKSLDYQFLICGPGSDQDHRRLELLIKEKGLEGRVRLLGGVKDAQRWFLGADVFLQPSLAEAFGLVFTEAGAAGLPAVSYRVGGISEIIAHESTGLLCEVGNIDALTANLQSILTDAAKREHMGTAARTRIEASFTLERMTELYAKTMNRLVEKTK